MAETGQTHDIDRIVGQRVRDLRLRRGWTQQDVVVRLRSYDISLHQTAIARLEAGRRAVGISEAVSLARVFGVSLNDLVTPRISIEAIKELEAEVKGLEERVAMLENERRMAIDHSRAISDQLRDAEALADRANQQWAMWMGTLAAARQQLAAARAESEALWGGMHEVEETGDLPQG
ncbi:helix-turn-helix transcriptional regulator [Microbispora hainanensis]|uniref:helix-turn-helix transcriptional regulator n=1 Tax=Microbispora hainanensis TaxID=568844 RepID=UPI0033E81BAB